MHDQTGGVCRGFRGTDAAMHLKGNHVPEPLHLSTGTIMPAVACEPRVTDALDLWMRSEAQGELAGVGLCLAESQGKSPNAAQGQIRLHWTWDCSAQ